MVIDDIYIYMYILIFYLLHSRFVLVFNEDISNAATMTMKVVTYAIATVTFHILFACCITKLKIFNSLVGLSSALIYT